MISIICAMDEKRGIGKDNKIPWHIKEDLVRFKTIVADHIIILGRNTYESMVWYFDKSGKELPGKLYTIVTSNKDYKATRKNTIVVHSFEEALQKADEILHSVQDDNKKEVFVIGGGQIFAQALPLANKLYLTIVEGEFDCDTFFPDYSEFKEKTFEQKGESGVYKYKFLTLEK